MGMARWKGGAANRGSPVCVEGRGFNIAIGVGSGGSRTGPNDRRGRVTPAEEGALTSDALSMFVRNGLLCDEVRSSPDKIRTLQRKLFCKAKAEPSYRFYLLCDKICRKDIFCHAYALPRANAAESGVDGVTFTQIDALGVEASLAGQREELVSKMYRPDPIRRVAIPKPGGDERLLGIVTIGDRMVQTAATIVLEPIFEAYFWIAPVATVRAAPLAMQSRKRTG